MKKSYTKKQECPKANNRFGCGQRKFNMIRIQCDQTPPRKIQSNDTEQFLQTMKQDNFSGVTSRLKPIY